LLAAVPALARLQLVWPTPNTAYLEGRPIADYVQPTVSGEAESGLFGGVRSNGYKFHEGLDLLPVKRDKSGEPADQVFAIMDGVVRHVNLSSGESSYGRYIVIEHPGATPAFCSLYAHLRSSDVRVGDNVSRGQVIALMGRSAGGYSIPKERGHLHFEMALEITSDFQRWYVAQKFGSPNKHGMHNGMNLMGVDPRDFYDEFRAKRVNDFGEYLARQPVAVRVRVGQRKVPDFVLRYPSLLKSAVPVGALAGWEIDLLWTGLPVALRPLTSAEAGTLRSGAVEIVKVDEDLVTRQRSIRLVRARGNGWQSTKNLDEVLGKLFGP
jgi:murein DD-endopeptidase MepM/ murein hydrolase activator NlpD